MKTGECLQPVKRADLFERLPARRKFMRTPRAEYAACLDVVRRLAQQANQFVLTHLTLLESTGLVDYADDVPTPPDPPPLHLTSLAAVEARAGTGGAPAPAIWAVLAMALLAGGLAVARVLRPG